LEGGDADAQWAAYRALHYVTKIFEPRRLCAWPSDWGESETVSPQITRARALSVSCETWMSFCLAMDSDHPVMFRVGDRVRRNSYASMRGTGTVVDVDAARTDGAWYSVFWETATKTWERSQDLRRV
jgi:hypothetical protein